MNAKALLLVTAASPLLLGCDILNKSSNSIDVQASQMQPFSPVNANYRDGIKTNPSELKGGGISGVMGNADGTLTEVQVRIGPEEQTAFVSIDGAPEVEFDIQSSYSEYGNYYLFGNWNDADGNSVRIYGSNDSYGDIQLSENGTETARGRISLETAPENLPESASYSGYFNTVGEIGTYGQIVANVNFANGDIDGGITGNTFNESQFSDSNTAFYGTIDGSVTGSHIAGTAFVTGGATGDLDFAGSATGESAQNLVGGIAGTLSVDGEGLTTGGDFGLYRQDGEHYDD